MPKNNILRSEYKNAQVPAAPSGMSADMQQRRANYADAHSFLGFGRKRALNDFDENYYDQVYNDYSSQVNRMQQAGLNPDFQSVTANESDMGSSNVNAAAQRRANFLSGLGSVSGLASVFTTAFGIYQNMVSNDAQMLSALGGTEGILKNISGRAAYDLKTKGIDSDTIAKSLVNGDKDFSSLLNIRKGYDDFLREFRSKRYRRALSARIASYIGSDEFVSDVLDKMKGVSDSAKGAVSSKGDLKAVSSFSDSSGFSGMSEGMRILAHTAYENNLAQLKFNKAKADFDAKYFNTGSELGLPGVSAQRDFNKTRFESGYYYNSYLNGNDKLLAGFEAARLSFQRTVAENNARMVRDLDEASKGNGPGSFFSQLLLVLLSSTQNGVSGAISDISKAASLFK